MDSALQEAIRQKNWAESWKLVQRKGIRVKPRRFRYAWKILLEDNYSVQIHKTLTKRYIITVPAISVMGRISSLFISQQIFRTLKGARSAARRMGISLQLYKEHRIDLLNILLHKEYYPLSLEKLESYKEVFNSTAFLHSIHMLKSQSRA